MAEVTTNAATLSAEASNFDRIGGELTQVAGTVQGIASEAASHLTGAAGTALQQALVRFDEKAQAQVKVLSEIHTNIAQAGIKYSAADDDQAGGLAASMNI